MSVKWGDDCTMIGVDSEYSHFRGFECLPPVHLMCALKG